MRADEYRNYDALGLAELVSAGDVSSSELMHTTLSLMDQYNPLLNAVVERRDDRALDEALTHHRGSFSGVPFLVKDMDGVLGGEPNTSSSRSLVNWRPVQDSELFARFKRSGLIIVGKTNCPEFGIMGVTESELRGPAHNPWNLDHTPGGSSGGSAAAVAARIVPMAHAGDGGGSIRIPASACGIFGIKPTRGRQPLGPYLAEGWNGYVVPGVVSISVRDSAAALDATHGADLGAPYAEPKAPRSFRREAEKDPGTLRIGFSTKAMLGSNMHPDTVAGVMDTVDLLESLGHEVVEVDLPLDAELLAKTYLTIVAAGVAAAIAGTEQQTGKKPDPDDFELATWFLGQVGRELSALELEQARTVSFNLGRTVAKTYQDHKLDVHLSSTLAFPPSKIGELQPSMPEKLALSTLRRAATGSILRLVLDQLAANSLAKTPNTQIFNMTGQPAMSVPLYWNADGLPIGMQFAGKFGDEVTLLRLATQLEQARGWASKLPPLLGR